VSKPLTTCLSVAFVAFNECAGQFPPKDTVYEYLVDPKTNTWTHWEAKLSQGWSFPSTLPFYKILVPTVDTLRSVFIFVSIFATLRLQQWTLSGLLLFNEV
jgi:hypothetical protein